MKAIKLKENGVLGNLEKETKEERDLDLLNL